MSTELKSLLVVVRDISTIIVGHVHYKVTRLI